MASLYYPMGLATDNDGDVYIADFQNGKIRQVNKEGIITTAMYLLWNNKGVKEQHYPNSICFNKAGDLLITLGFEHRIIKVGKLVNNAPIESVHSSAIKIYPNPANYSVNIDGPERNWVVFQNTTGQGLMDGKDVKALM